MWHFCSECKKCKLQNLKRPTQKRWNNLFKCCPAGGALYLKKIVYYLTFKDHFDVKALLKIFLFGNSGRRQ